MNYKMFGYILAYVLKVEAALMLLPLCISIFEKEHASAVSFAITILILFVASLPLSFKKPQNSAIYAKEGFAIVALSWIVLSIGGALPFYFSGTIPSFIDCLFESVSGFTTTGSSILTKVEMLPRGILFWRSFTHWIGGMGVLIFILSIMSASGSHLMHLIRAESPGPITGKLVPKIGNSAKILYLIYLALTIIETILLCLGGMPLFDSIVHSMGTAGTGGFSIKNASIAAYDSVYIDAVITIFMFLFGVNFYLYYILLLGKFKAFFKSEELRVYFCIVLGSILLISLDLYLAVYPTFGESIRYASFQVSSIITTTGFATADFDGWPDLSRFLLVMLMFIGASAGSTGGGIKVSRVVIYLKSAFREVGRVIHHQSVSIIRLDGKRVPEETVSAVNGYLGIYMLISVFSMLVIAIFGKNLDLETTVTAVIACINNIGPGLSLVGATGNFSFFNPIQKIVLIIDMLVGRLEIFPMLILFSPAVLKDIRFKSRNTI